jgi:hypothetical protein
VPESVIVSVPDADPKAVGVNVTEIVQLLPAPSDEPHVVLLIANGPAVPVVMEMEAVVLLLTVAFFAALLLLTGTLPKERLVGDRETWAWARWGPHIEIAISTQSLIATGTNRDPCVFRPAAESLNLYLCISVLPPSHCLVPRSRRVLDG